MREEPCEDGGCRVVRQRPARGSRGEGYAAAVAGRAMAARRAMLAVRRVGGEGGVAGGDGVIGARRGRLAGSRIDSQRQRRR
jgi:hypothetical protein